ncbi:LysR family transcriptional regulator [Pontibacterium sp. N1Y112]|uniref:LysR family transcriptional regulator n=1 Tax=Pontibacterium sinense TaxID=2781979 RepID=A0A8J7K5K2_9GAMM|nr:LysR family transcriptional regulator [Pontibacterium sinense]MBE9397100.1 LysR family transcriptional regulator [Pontibacterium sinense]
MSGSRSNMLRLIRCFTRVVDAGSFSAAAYQLGMNKGAVSQAISTLEAETKLRLLNRDTRHVSLTESGRHFYNGCQEVLQSVERLDELTDHLTGENSGTLRVACSNLFGSRVLVPALNHFMEFHPHLKMDLCVQDDVASMADGAIDVTVRIGWPQDSSLIARRLFETRQLVVSTPEYLHKHRAPLAPEELREMNWLSLTRHRFRNLITLTDREDHEYSVPLNSRMLTDNSAMLFSLLMANNGITALPECNIISELEQGDLVELLPDFKLEPLGVYVIYPSRDNLPQKTRLFVDFMLDYFRSYPFVPDL